MAEDQKAPAKNLEPGRMWLAEFKRTVYTIDVQRGVQPQDLVEPDFWVHYGAQLKPWDRIEARADDGTWCAEYVVLDSSRTYARVVMLSQHRLTTGDVAMTEALNAEAKKVIDGHEVKHAPQRKWHIVNTANRKVLAEGFQTRDEAVAHLNQHALAQIGRAPAPAAPVTA